MTMYSSWHSIPPTRHPQVEGEGRRREKEGIIVATPVKALNLRTNTGKALTAQEAAFISEYIGNGGNARAAVIAAGYRSKAPDKYGSTLLNRQWIAQEISYRLKEREEAGIAKRAEILQFYTSVMRGEVLDQFGIEASLDTRIKAANELSKHMIEMPLKIEQKNITNNIGSIQLNFIPRQEDAVVLDGDFVQDAQ